MGGGVKQDSPFTGNGFTGSHLHVIPELKLAARSLPEGAEIYLLSTDGAETLLAVYDEQQKHGS